MRNEKSVRLPVCVGVALSCIVLGFLCPASGSVYCVLGL
jgi:hypothetical protein